MPVRDWYRHGLFELDLEILAEYPPPLSEGGFEKATLTGLGNEKADTTRTALSARAADVGEHRKTENELGRSSHAPLPARTTG